MALQYANPFRNMDLISPITQQEHYDDYCQTGQRGPKADMVPFPRKVDLWFAGLSLAVRKRLAPVDIKKLKKKETVSIITGEIFNTDGWQAQAVMLIAIAVKGDLEVVLNPREMMDLANGLAAAGVPHIVKMLSEGDQRPIWNLSEALAELLQSDPVTEEKSDQERLAEVLR